MRFNMNLPPPSYAGTDEEATELLSSLMDKVDRFPEDPIGFDTETHAKKLPFKVGARYPLDHITDTVTFWSIAFRREPEAQTERWCMRQEHFRMFTPLFENPKARLAIWNAKFDAHIAWNSDIDIWNAHVYDVLVMANMYDENYQGRMGLKDAAPRWINLNMTKFKDLFEGITVGGKAVKEYEISLYELPLEKVIDYASADAYAHLELFYFLKSELELTPLPGSNRTLWDLFLEVEVPCTETLWRMERRGMHIDSEHLNAMIPLVDNELDTTAREINQAAGRILNINSPKQLQEYFFGGEGLGLEPIKISKATQKPSCDVEVLTKLAEDHGMEIAKNIIRSRGLNKTKGTYLVPLSEMAAYFPDKRIHPNFHQYGARTGRFSSTGPNSMNFPRPGNDEFHIRRAFIAPPGKRLIVGDFGQLEMRIMSHMSGDRAMLKAIQSGEDLHCRTVNLMFGIPYEEVVDAKKAENPTEAQKELLTLRQHAKTVGFGIIYGIGPPGLSKQLDIPFDDAKAKIKMYLRKAFPGVNSYIQDTTAMCASQREVYTKVDRSRQECYVTTILGRRRRLPDILLKDRGLAGHAEREACNATIQGSAADITKCAMLRIEYNDTLNALGVWLLNQIHDEIVLEVPEENAEEALKLVTHCMEWPFGDDNPALDVPLEVDIKIVDSWDQAK